jgi:beta-xylosidase
MNNNRIISTVILLLIIGIPLLADANPPTTYRVITVDFRQIQGQLDTMFKKCVGAGRANEGLRADWQRQLTYAHRECGFQYIRMHGLFCDDMGIYKESKDGKPEYNWQYIDELYDFTITHLGTKVNNQVYYKRDLPSLPKNKVTLNLTNVPEGEYALDIYKVGYRINDAYMTYMDLGSPSQLTKAQVAKIKSDNSGAPIASSTVKVGLDGKVQQQFDLRENDVYLFILKRL